jgi:hypothetical protein
MTISIFPSLRPLERTSQDVLPHSWILLQQWVRKIEFSIILLPKYIAGSISVDFTSKNFDLPTWPFKLSGRQGQRQKHDPYDESLTRSLSALIFGWCLHILVYTRWWHLEQTGWSRSDAPGAILSPTVDYRTRNIV